MSCRHDLANGTCTRCYPGHPRAVVDPGPEEDYEPNLEGPGAVTAEQYWSAQGRPHFQSETQTMLQLSVDETIRQLVVEFLNDLSERLSSDGCNDWRWPAWVSAEAKVAIKQLHPDAQRDPECAAVRKVEYNWQVVACLIEGLKRPSGR